MDEQGNRRNNRRRFCNGTCRVRWHRNHERIENLSRILESLMLAGIVLPMVLGIGCAVPAIYATRTLSSRRDRILTALLTPLMSCSARLPVYVVFGLALFGAQAGTVIWLMYAIGIVVALLAGAVFTRTLLKPDQTSAFVLELPPYRRPTLRGLLIHMWERVSEFVSKAGTTILASPCPRTPRQIAYPSGASTPRPFYPSSIARVAIPSTGALQLIAAVCVARR